MKWGYMIWKYYYMISNKIVAILLIIIFFYASFKTFFMEIDAGLQSIQSNLDVGGDSE